MITLSDNLRLSANSYNFILEKKNNASTDLGATEDDKSGLWKKYYHSSLNSVYRALLGIDSDVASLMEDTMALIEDIEEISSANNHNKEYSVSLDMPYSIYNNRFGYILDFGNGKLKYMHTSALLFRCIMWHDVLKELENEDTSILKINNILASLKDIIKNAEFKKINIETEVEDYMEDEVDE